MQVVSFPGLWKSPRSRGQDQGRGPGQACLQPRGAPGAAVRTFFSLFVFIVPSSVGVMAGGILKDRGGTWVSKPPPGCSVRPDLEPVGGGDGQRCRPDLKQGVGWWRRVTEGNRQAQVGRNIRERQGVSRVLAGMVPVGVGAQELVWGTEGWRASVRSSWDLMGSRQVDGAAGCVTRGPQEEGSRGPAGSSPVTPSLPFL